MADWRSVVLAIRAAAILFTVIAAESGIRSLGWAAATYLMISSMPAAGAIPRVVPPATGGVVMLGVSLCCAWAFFNPQRFARKIARRITR